MEKIFSKKEFTTLEKSQFLKLEIKTKMRKKQGRNLNQHLNFLTGFTFVELLVVVGIAVILLAITIVSFKAFHRKSDLDNASQEILTILRLAQNKTLASEGGSKYGVYFDNSSSPHQYILFKGNSYGSRDISFDEVYKLAKIVEISQINLGGSLETVFSRVEGRAFPSGNVGLRLTTDVTETRTIYIEESGLVSLSSVLAPADGRVTDARHVHFNLGWSIQTATTLKFYFPNIPQTETIEMMAYFNPAKTEFDWRGTFVVGGVDQVFKVHTHFLDPLTTPYTRLCIHRDRNNGKTDQEVIIYIVDGGIDKEIAHYLADAADTVNEGIFGGTKEIQ